MAINRKLKNGVLEVNFSGLHAWLIGGGIFLLGIAVGLSIQG